MRFAMALLLAVPACCGLAHAENPVRLRLDLDGEWQSTLAMTEGEVRSDRRRYAGAVPRQ
jgi:hypothetical protein